MPRNPAACAPASLARYFAEVSRSRVLTMEEEQALARAYRDTGDAALAHRLVTANLRFVVKIAYSYRGCGARLTDLIQEGNLGLMKAVQRFDPDRGLRLVTYAAWSIRAYMQAYLLRTRSLVKPGSTRAKRNETLPRATPDVSLDAPVGDDRATTLLDLLGAGAWVPDHGLVAAQVEALVRRRVGEAVSLLAERERHIVEQRFLGDEPRTLTAIAAELGLSRERVRQLEARAKSKLRHALEALTAEIGWPVTAGEGGEDGFAAA